MTDRLHQNNKNNVRCPQCDPRQLSRNNAINHIINKSTSQGKTTKYGGWMNSAPEQKKGLVWAIRIVREGGGRGGDEKDHSQYHMPLDV